MLASDGGFGVAISLGMGILSLLVLLRMYMILPNTRSLRKRNNDDGGGPKSRRNSAPVKTLAVLGSGGHTAEMCTLLRSLDPRAYAIRFIVARTDSRSLDMVRSNLHDVLDVRDQFHFIPRSREVHQSFVTSVFSTCYALVHSIWVVLFVIRPDLILANGPGTCVPVCMAAYIPRFLGLKHIKIVYVESAARVKSLSLTGRILYYSADRFLVQWPSLAERYPRAEYHGRLT